jgi:lambda repressor-like predicted transcriptional regulator
MNEPNAGEAISTNESEQQLPAGVVSSDKPRKELAAERKAFLDKRLKIKGYSLRVLATQAGVARYTVRCYRSGKTNPHPTTLWKLAQALGISIEEMPR